MQKISYKIINAITAYRIIAAPSMLLLIFTGNQDLFKWLLPVSFFTDLIDGYLARKYKVVSRLGARLDSLGDDLTVLVGIIGLFVFKPDFIQHEIVIACILLGLFGFQNVFAFARYRKISSFHTYLAKIAALLQGVFLMLIFILPEPLSALFYTASIVTVLDLVEEIILVAIIPEWRVNVKGLYWVLRHKRESKIRKCAGNITIPNYRLQEFLRVLQFRV